MVIFKIIDHHGSQMEVYYCYKENVFVLNVYLEDADNIGFSVVFSKEEAGKMIEFLSSETEL